MTSKTADILTKEVTVNSWSWVRRSESHFLPRGSMEPEEVEGIYEGTTTTKAKGDLSHTLVSRDLLSFSSTLKTW